MRKPFEIRIHTLKEDSYSVYGLDGTRLLFYEHPTPYTKYENIEYCISSSAEFSRILIEQCSEAVFISSWTGELLVFCYVNMYKDFPYIFTPPTGSTICYWKNVVIQMLYGFLWTSRVYDPVENFFWR